MSDILNLSELRGIDAADARPAFQDVAVPMWGGKKVRIRRLSAHGLINILDLWAELPKDADGLATALPSDLVDFYETLLADVVVDASNMPLFANLDDRKILQKHPGALVFLGKSAREFNDDLLSVKTEKKSEPQPEISPSPSAEPLDTPSSTPTT